MAALDDKETRTNSLDDIIAGEDNSTSPTGISTSDEKQNEQEPPPRPPYLTGWKWFVYMAAIVSSTFLYALDGTIVAVLQPGFIEEFGHIENLSWLTVAFLLCATATNLAWGRTYSNHSSLLPPPWPGALYTSLSPA